VAYYRPNDANTWASYWHKGYVFIADFTRGVDIIKLGGQAATAPTIVAPPLAPGRSLSEIGVQPDRLWHWMCARPTVG
jgi:hypothetical protein